MYLKFTTLTECQNCISEIDKRMNFTSDITETFTKPMQDIYLNYIIPKPKDSIINESIKLSNIFTYIEVENVEFPVIEEV